MSFRFDPHDPAFVRDPYPTYKEMRDGHPVYRMEETGFWLITRFDDVSRALADPATFSSSRGNSTVDTPVRVGKTLGTIDPPRHDDLRKRQNSRGDDLFSVLIAAREQGANLSEEEIVANMMTVLLAGGASINHFFSNLMYALWLHPESRKAVREDLGLIDAAVEEGVRWDTSTQCFARHLTAEVTVAGVALPAQSRAILFYGSANRDERAIADANRFDIRRPRVRHFGWGSGPHFCFGAPTAKAMLRTILQEALPALGDYELDMDKAVRVNHTMVRGFKTLPVRL